MRLGFIALCAVGCMSTAFVRTDPSFRPVKKGVLPPFYLDRLPERPYRGVGIIEVKGPAGTSLGAFVREARKKAADLGCDVVVDRSIHRVMSELPDAGPLLAQYPYTPPAQQQPRYYPVQAAPPPDRREFICGIFVQPPSGPSGG